MLCGWCEHGGGSFVTFGPTGWATVQDRIVSQVTAPSSGSAPEKTSLALVSSGCHATKHESSGWPEARPARQRGQRLHFNRTTPGPTLLDQTGVSVTYLGRNFLRSSARKNADLSSTPARMRSPAGRRCGAFVCLCSPVEIICLDLLLFGRKRKYQAFAPQSNQ